MFRWRKTKARFMYRGAEECARMSQLYLKKHFLFLLLTVYPLNNLWENINCVNTHAAQFVLLMCITAVREWYGPSAPTLISRTHLSLGFPVNAQPLHCEGVNTHDSQFVLLIWLSTNIGPSWGVLTSVTSMAQIALFVGELERFFQLFWTSFYRGINCTDRRWRRHARLPGNKSAVAAYLGLAEARARASTRKNAARTRKALGPVLVNGYIFDVGPNQTL